MTALIDSDDFPAVARVRPGRCAGARSPARLATYCVAGRSSVFCLDDRSSAASTSMSSSNVTGGAITLAIPIMAAGLGGLWSERAGVVNIGLEGQMIMGTWFAADFAWKSGSPWMLIVGGIVGGVLGGALHALATVYFGVDQIISGVAINILAPPASPSTCRESSSPPRRPSPIGRWAYPVAQGQGALPRAGLAIVRRLARQGP